MDTYLPLLHLHFNKKTLIPVTLKYSTQFELVQCCFNKWCPFHRHQTVSQNDVYSKLHIQENNLYLTNIAYEHYS